MEKNILNLDLNDDKNSTKILPTTLSTSSINYACMLSCLEYSKFNNLLLAGDERGRISFFDIRQSKPVVKLINQNTIKSDVK
jgi:hypothetical protein